MILNSNDMLRKLQIAIFVTCFFYLFARFVPGGPPVGTRPVPSKPLQQPTRDIAAIKVKDKMQVICNSYLQITAKCETCTVEQVCITD